jgi:hypothetical protein
MRPPTRAVSTTTASDYNRQRDRMARKAWREFCEFVNIHPRADVAATKRAVGYLVRRMGFNTVIREQMPNWILGHMMEFVRREVRLDRKERRR